MSNISKNHQFIVEGEIQSAFGFYKFFYANLIFYSNVEQCYEYCNHYFRSIFGYNRYENFKKFRGGIEIKNICAENKVSIDLIQNKPDLSKIREVLISLFILHNIHGWQGLEIALSKLDYEFDVKDLIIFYSRYELDEKLLDKLLDLSLNLHKL